MLHSLRILFALVLAVSGAILARGGLELLGLGGSAYYLIAGAVLVISGVLVGFRWRAGACLFLLVLCGTVVWAVWESGLAFWPLAPRIGWFAFLALWLWVPWNEQGLDRGGPVLTRAGGATLLLATLVGVALMAWIHEPDGPASGPPVAATAHTPPAQAASAVSDEHSEDWRAYGRLNTGTRYSPLDQITPDNVAKLQVAWTFHTGDPSGDHSQLSEDTPLAIGNTLFLCTPHHMVYAVNGDTGEQLWRFDPREGHTHSMVRTCRGVGYGEATSSPSTAASEPSVCSKRIINQTGDNRLIALDADTGEPCDAFGKKGSVDLNEGIGPHQPGEISSTAAPLVVGTTIVIGSLVLDNGHTGEPSGVIRAYDLLDGHLRWAWDMGRPGEHGVPPEGQTYTPATPNAWSMLTADADRKLVFVPLGNQTPDFYAANRLPVSERFSTALVALDLETGELRWSFQTTHHDMWDYDLPAQPVLVNFPLSQGQSRPAVILPTKRGEFFVLDRETGVPLTPVEERPVPQGAAPGDFTSPTQPFSVGMPELNDTPLTERQMWGITPMDQMACRIQFRHARYEGQFTPQSTQGTINYPGNAGFMDWGGVSVDETRQLMLVNSIRLPFILTLIPRAEVQQQAQQHPERHMRGMDPQSGTAFAVTTAPMESPAKVPCLQPPWGYIGAVDLNTRKFIWRHTLGTGRDSGPFGWKVGPPLPIGVFSQGGSMVTRSGLTFISSTTDLYARAFDSQTGQEVWRARLPAGGQASPMSYQSTKTGRQYVVITAGGHTSMETAPGDSVIAFALPR